jgi:hypothetical protein
MAHDKRKWWRAVPGKLVALAPPLDVDFPERP